MTEREQFIEDWMEIGKAFLPEDPEDEIRKRVEAAAAKHFAFLDNEGDTMDERYKRELEAFLESAEESCPPGLSEEQKQARRKMLIEFFNESMIETVEGLDEV